MFTWGSKYLFAVSGASMLGAALYGLTSGGDIIGVFTLGYKGGVGEHTGYVVLVVVALVTALLGTLSVITRDGDSEASSDVAGVDYALTVSTPRVASYWGPMAAFSLACLAVGAAVERAFFILGLAILAVVALEWLVLAWSDRATGDDTVNSTIRNRVLGPIEVPLLSLLGIAVVVLGLSRILLAVSEIGSTVVAAVFAATVFGAAVAIAKSNAPRSVITGVVAVAAVAVLGGGLAGAVQGERQIAHHEEGDDHSEDGHSEDGEDGAEAEGEGE